MWTYIQLTGVLSKDGIRVGVGYSGFAFGKNRPASESIPDVGPIPCGLWLISSSPFNSPEHGPYCLRLQPAIGTETFGRSAFLLHGDSIEHPGEASKGCIILPRDVRSTVWQSGDYQLTVVSGIAAEPLKEQP